MLKKNEIIRKLKNNLLQLDLFSEDSIRQIKQDSEKQQQGDQKDSEGRIVKLQEEIAQLRTQLNNSITEHRSTEQSLRKVHYHVLVINGKYSNLHFSLSYTKINVALVNK